MTREEHETLINYSYCDEQVSIYTTRRGVRNQLIKRLPEEVPEITVHSNGGREVAWTIRAPMDYFRAPPLITKGPTTVGNIADRRAA